MDYVGSAYLISINCFRMLRLMNKKDSGLLKTRNNFENSSNVNDMHKKWYSSKIQANSGCNKPCSYVTLRANTVWERENRYKTISKLLIYFKENVKITKAYHVYSGLSLIAEIGGYVGLFLGVSINQITNLFDIIFQQINKH